MTRRFVSYAAALGAAVLIVVALIQLGGSWYPLPAGPAVAAPASTRSAVAQMADVVRQPLPRLLVQLL